MSKTTLAAGTSPFAHLLAGAAALGSRVTGRRAEDEKPGEDAEEDKPDEEDKPGGRRARGRKAEESDDEERAEDDDDDEDMAKARREGFAAAQARGRKIFSAASAGLRPDMAAHLAFNETSHSAKAIDMLDMAANGSAPQGGTRLGRRMARVVIPNPGNGGQRAGSDPKSDVAAFADFAKQVAAKAGI